MVTSAVTIPPTAEFLENTFAVGNTSELTHRLRSSPKRVPIDAKKTRLVTKRYGRIEHLRTLITM